MLYKEDENFINKMDYSFFENKNYTTLKELADELNITNYKNKKDLIMNIISFFKNYESIGKQYQKERETEVRKPVSPSESKTESRKSVSPSETKTEVRKPVSSSETKTEVRKPVSPSETKTEVRKSTQEKKDSKTEIIRKQVSENKENEARKPLSKVAETKTEVNKTTVSEIKDNKYNIIKQIGNVGKEGITYLVKRNNDGSEFAMKTFKKTKSSKNILIESELQNIAS